MALVCGVAIAKLPKPYYGIILSIIAIEAIANQQHAQFISENVNYKLTLEQLADSSIAKDELIIINGGIRHSPFIYQTIKLDHEE